MIPFIGPMIVVFTALAHNLVWRALVEWCHQFDGEVCWALWLEWLWCHLYTARGTNLFQRHDPFTQRKFCLPFLHKMVLVRLSARIFDESMFSLYWRKFFLHAKNALPYLSFWSRTPNIFLTHLNVNLLGKPYGLFYILPILLSSYSPTPLYWGPHMSTSLLEQL